MSWFKTPLQYLGLAWTLVFLGCTLANHAWAEDIEIDLGETPTVAAPSQVSPRVSPVTSFPVKTNSLASHLGRKSGRSVIRNIVVSSNPLGSLVSMEGTIPGKPVVEKISSKKLLIKFPNTLLQMKSRLEFKNELVGTIRSAAHGKNAWVVLEIHGVQGWKISQTSSGYDLILQSSEASQPPVENTTLASIPTSIPSMTSASQTGLFARLIEASFKPLDNGVKLVLTSDQPAEYTVRKLSQPDRLIVRFHDTKLDMTQKMKVFTNANMELVKGGLVSMELRQIGPRFSPISEVILTLVPGALDEIQRDLNQVVVTLTAPMAAQAPSSPKADINQLVSLDVQNANLSAVLEALAGEANFDVDFVSPVSQVVNEKFDKVPLKIALSNLLSPGLYDFEVQGDTIRIGTESILKASKLMLPKVTEIIHPEGGMTPQQLDTLVRAILNPNNTSISSFDTVRNVIALHGTASDVAEYRKTMDDLKLGSDSMGDRITKVIRLNYSDPAAVMGILTPYLTPVGKVQVDTRTDSVIIWDTASNMGTLLELVKELDIKSPQVLIESNIVEVDKLDALNLGFNWNINSSANTQPSVTGSFTNALQNTAITPASLMFGTVQGGVSIDATLDALQTHQIGKIISRPRVATVSGVPAEINSVENVIYITNQQTVGLGGVVTNNVVYNTLPLPVDLKITPRITDDGQITTSVVATVTSQTGPPSGPGAPPPTSVQTATTTITIKNGQTIVIGGLVRDTLQDTYNGVPLLMNLPLIGDLFQQKTLSDTKVELVIFITPTIMPN